MEMKKGTIQDYNFQSDILDEEIPLLIYLPPGYSPMEQYPTIIVQDGKDYFQYGRLPRVMDELISNDMIEKAIIVASHYKSVADRRSKYHPEGEKNKQFTLFLIEELAPWIDQNFATNGNRTMMGDSLAGTVSLMTAIQYPNKISGAILHSPYVDDYVLEKVSNYQSPIQLSFYQIIGKDEHTVAISNNRDFLTPNRKLREIFEEKGFQLFYDEFEGGHSWKYWQKDIKRALLHMFALEN